MGGVVQGALQPLGGAGLVGAGHQPQDEPGQGVDALAAHGVALVGHGRGADLLRLEGLLHFLQVLEQAQVAGELGGRGGDAAEHLAHAVLQLAGGGLAGDGDGRDAHLGAEPRLQGLHLGPVAVEQLQEAGLGAR